MKRLEATGEGFVVIVSLGENHYGDVSAKWLTAMWCAETFREVV